jgi:hypothetical protein
VRVDEITFQVAAPWETPISCELPPGRHVLRMSRGSEVLHSEEFWVDPGQEVVLTAWNSVGARSAERPAQGLGRAPRVATRSRKSLSGGRHTSTP